MTVTADYQIEYGGLAMGDGTDYDFLNFEGFGIPEVISADTELVGRHGLAAGVDRLGGRFFELALEVDGTADTLDARLAALGLAFAPAGVETPFVFQIPGVAGGGVRRILARPRGAFAPIGLARAFGELAEVVIPLGATDPRIYDEAETSTETVLASTSGGLTWPLTWPLAWGTTLSGIIAPDNTGNFETGATLTMTGPVTNPRVENLTTGQLIGVTLVVADGSTLVIDLTERTVLLNGTASRMSALTAASEWWTLQPGENQIRYGADTATASTLTVRHRSAWIL